MDSAVSRRNMVDCQILPNHVTDPRIIDAMLEIPRERFLPENMGVVAYADKTLPMGNGRFMMEPVLMARLLQTVRLKADDVVLSIGCQGGYGAAMIARMVNTVVALECDKKAVKKTSNILAEMGVDNVAVVAGALRMGKVKQGPFDVIVFHGGISCFPLKISDQLAEGGRMIGVVIERGVMGTARLVTRQGGGLSSRDVFDAGTPYLPGFEPKSSFAF